MKNKPGLISICLSILVLTSLIFSGCAPQTTPTPSPVPKAPAPAAPSVTAPSIPAAVSPSPVAKPSPKPYEWPKPMVWGALDVGSAGYLIGAALADTFLRELGVTVRVVPSGTDTGRISLLMGKRVQFSMLGAGAFMAQEGAEEFAAIDVGPLPLRATIGTWASWSLTSAKDANIKTPADMKGKRVAWIAGFPSVNANHGACLAFANLTWNDVVKVEFPSFGVGGTGLVQGKCDVLQGLTTTAFNYELAASPRGLYFIPLPAADKAGWSRLNKTVPYMASKVATEGPGLSETVTYEGGTYPNPAFLCTADQDTEMVYQQTKQLVELYDKYSKVKAPGIGDFALKYQRFDWVMPYHEGAIRYYKEIGKWTEAAQKHNDKLLERQKVLKQAWDKAIAEGAEKQVKAADYAKFWYDIRAQALKAAGFDPYWKAPGFVPYE